MDKNTEARILSEKHAATCFLNSLFRECTDHVESASAISLRTARGELRLPLARRSRLGRHAYAGTYFLNDKQIEFSELIDSLATHVGSRLGSQASTIDRLTARVESSRQTVEETLKSWTARGLSFIESEQSLVVGHSFHPTPKSRNEMTIEDRRAYTPELGASFALTWLLASPQIVELHASRAFGETAWTTELARQELRDEMLRAPWVPVPMHPWQMKKLRRHPAIRAYFKDGRLSELPQARAQWKPTSSVRSLYREDAPYMLKFSMSVKLTNSIRHLLVREVERGPQLHDVLLSPNGQEFSRECPTFGIVHEPAYLFFKDLEGQPINESIVVCRENPFREKRAEEQVVLATLAQDAVSGETSLLKQLVRNHDDRSWFRAYLQHVVRPLFVAQAKHGFILCAHQQNLIISLRDGFPIGAWFRDCQGTGYSELGFKNFATAVPSIYRENGNVVNAEMGTSLFTYYLILNSTFNLISALAAATTQPETTYLDLLREELRSLRAAGFEDNSALDLILESKSLQHKGNFLCALREINENTSADPLEIYTPVSNPLFKEEPMVELQHRALARDRSFHVLLGRSQIKVDDFEASFEIHESTARLRVTREAHELETLVALEMIFAHFPEVKRITGDRESVRSEFYQSPALWHHRGSYEIAPERWIESSGRRHPQRLETPVGTLYRRYIAPIQKTLSFRALEIDRDLAKFHEWQNQPRVAALWELNQSADELRGYLTKLQQDAHAEPLIMELDGEPVGYFEIYWAAEDRIAPFFECQPFDRGFHFLIGEAKYLGVDNTSAAIASIMHFIYLDEARTRHVVAEPRADNKRVLKYVQLVPGWRFIKEFDFPHKRAALLMAKREDYFLEGAP